MEGGRERGWWWCYIMAEGGGLGARGRGAVEVSLTLTRRMDDAHMDTCLPAVRRDWTAAQTRRTREGFIHPRMDGNFSNAGKR
jgi:hypothetical protein